MAREFFEDAADALMGFLPPDLRAEASLWTGSRNLKVWFPPHIEEHYEIQIIGSGPLKASKIRGKAPALEIGFHAENKDTERNQAALDRLTKREKTWRKALGADPEPAPFIGRTSPWLRLSELWHDDVEAPDAAIESAARLAEYIRAFERIRRA